MLVCIAAGYGLPRESWLVSVKFREDGGGVRRADPLEYLVCLP